MIIDHKNRIYTVLSASKHYTHAKCIETGAILIITNSLYKEMGFRS